MKMHSPLQIAALILAISFLIHGYPTANANIGPVVSGQTNPLIYATGSSSGTLFNAPADRIIVISDIVLTASGSRSGSQPCVSTVEISTTSDTLSYFQMTSDSSSNEGASHSGSTLSHAFAGGIPVAMNEQVSISISGSCTVNYLISGYHGHP